MTSAAATPPAPQQPLQSRHRPLFLRLLLLLLELALGAAIVLVLTTQFGLPTVLVRDLVQERLLDGARIPARFRLRDLNLTLLPPEGDLAWRLRLDLLEPRLKDLEGRDLVAADRITLIFAHASLEPDRTECLRPWVDLEALARALKRPRPTTPAPAPPTPLNQQSPRRRGPSRALVPALGFTITEGAMVVAPTLRLANVNLSLRRDEHRERDVLIEGLSLSAIASRGRDETASLVGPARGMVCFQDDGAVRWTATGTSPRLQGTTGPCPMDLDLTQRPDGSVRVDRLECGVPGEGRLALTATWNPGSTTAPLECAIDLRHVRAERLPLRADILGNLERGSLSMTGSFRGDPLAYERAVAACTFQVEEPRFLVLRGATTTPVDLMRLEGALEYVPARLDLKNLIVSGFGGRVTGGATLDFSAPATTGWATKLHFDGIALDQVARPLSLNKIERGTARGELELCGGGGVPADPSKRGITGHVLMESLDLDWVEPDRRMVFELRDAWCELRHEPLVLSSADLRRATLAMSGLARKLAVHDLAFRATSAGGRTTLEGLACRVGATGALRIDRADLPRSADERAELRMTITSAETALLDYLNLPAALPAGTLDAFVDFAGVPRRLNDARVKVSVAYEARPETPLISSFEGRFVIEGGSIALEGARAQLLGGFVEAAGRGRFEGTEPVGRGRVSFRRLQTARLGRPGAPLPGVLDGFLALTRSTAAQQPTVELELTGTEPLALDLAAKGELVNALRRRNPLIGSTLELRRLRISRDRAHLELPSAARLTLTTGALVLDAPTITAVAGMGLPTVALSLDHAAIPLNLLALAVPDHLRLVRGAATSSLGRLDLPAGGTVYRRPSGLEVALPRLGLSAGAREATPATLAATGVAVAVPAAGRTLVVRLDQAAASVASFPSPVLFSGFAATLTASGPPGDRRLRGEVKLTAESVTLPTSAPFTLRRLSTAASATGSQFLVPDLACDVPGARLSASATLPQSSGASPWSLGATLRLTDPLPLWNMSGGRGPQPHGSASVTVLVTGPGAFPPGWADGPYEARVALDGLRLLLERRLDGRTLDLKSLRARGGPGSGRAPARFTLDAADVTYAGPELRAPAGASSLRLDGTLRSGLLSLNRSLITFSRGGTLALTGAVPLEGGLDGEFAYALRDLDLAAWNPAEVVDLRRGLLTLDGTFVGAWGDIADSLIDLRFDLKDAEVSAGGISPGPFSLAAGVSYRKGSVALTDTRATLLGGLLTGQGSGRWDRERREVEVQTEFANIELARLLQANRAPDEAPPPAEGRLSGELTFKNRGSLSEGFLGSGRLSLDGGVLRKVATMYPQGQKFLARVDDLAFQRFVADLVLLGDVMTLKKLQIRSDIGSMEGWLRMQRRAATLEGRLYARLTRQLLPSAFMRTLAGLLEGEYLDVGLLLHGPLGSPRVKLERSPGRREKFLEP